MWFRNLCVYQLADAFALSSEQLESRLSGAAFQPVGPHDPETRGWVSPLSTGGELLAHVVSSRMMICLQSEARVLPAAVVKENVEQRAEEREAAMARPLGKRERTRLKEEVTMDLLPRAFTKRRKTYGYFDMENRWLVVDAGSWKEAETFTEDLRAALSSLPLRPLQTDSAPHQVMTEWLARDRFPGDLEPGEEAIFEDPRSEGAEIRCRRQDLRSNEIRAHIKAGKRVKRLAVAWDQRLEAVLDTDLSIKRLRFADGVQSDSGDREAETPAERFDADFAMMTGELARFIPRLRAWFD